MSHTVQARLDTGELVDVTVPEGMSDDEAGARFMQAYNANKQSFHDSAPAAQTEALQHDPFSVMNPQGPSSWDYIKDAGKSTLSGVPSGAENTVVGLGGRVPLGLAAAIQHLFGFETSPGIKEAAQRLERGSDFTRDYIGANYEPQTVPGDLLKSTAEGATGAAMMGGVGTGNLVLGGASGLASNLGTRFGGQMGGLAGSMAPNLAAGGIGVLRSPQSSIKIAKDALDRTKAQPGAWEDAQALQAAADNNGVPVMPWQLFPRQNAIRETGARAAQLPVPDSQIQHVLTQQQGPFIRDPATGAIDPTTEAQKLLTQRGGFMNMVDPKGNPVLNKALADNIAQTQSLRGADISGNVFSKLGSEEAGNVALLSSVLEDAVPNPLERITGSMMFQKLKPFTAWMQAPKNEMADQLYSAPNLNTFEQLANSNARIPYLKQLFQGAYGMPATLDTGPQADK